jgi:acyl-coenzyme A thioesterase PaaI-like protein
MTATASPQASRGWSTRWFRLLVNLYPPLACAGVHVTHIAPDWRLVRVRLALRWYNRNYVGTHFGGSLFAMTDPFLMIMVMKNLGPDYVVWDRAAQIEYVVPGRTTVWAEFRLDAEMLERLRDRTAGGEKYLHWFDVNVVTGDGAVVARVRRQLYVRRKGPEV